VQAQITLGGPDERFINDIDRIHQGDVIEVDVVGSFEFDWRGRLNPEGFIDGIERLPDPVYARCKSTAHIANLIAEQYRKVLRDPVVEVRIIDRNGRSLSYIDGAVKTPLRLTIKRDLYLNELIVLAGGFTDIIGDEVSIFRPEGASCEGARDGALPAGPVTKVIKIRDLIAGVDGTNSKIVPGDVVTVVESLPIYVIGGVSNPQRLSARAGITLSRAIDTAGGISKNGRGESVTIYRRNGINSQVIEVDLDKVRSGQSEDPPLEANDIVEVPFRGEDKRKFPPVIESRGFDRKQIPLRIIE
jgi:protein involved in polysaccharide export with SLBB domain